MNNYNHSLENSTRGNAFTLVELLVVIAIISILAGILMPVLEDANETAKQISCISNLRQFATANHMYVNDNINYFPFSTVDCRLWDYLLMPYVNYPQDEATASSMSGFTIFHCPSGKLYSGWTTPDSRRRGYGYNSRIAYFSVFVRSVSNIANPPKLVLMTDISNRDYDDSERHTFCKRPHNALVDPSGNVDNISYRHSEWTDILFADGHAENCGRDIYNAADDGWIPENTEW